MSAEIHPISDIEADLRVIANKRIDSFMPDQLAALTEFLSVRGDRVGEPPTAAKIRSALRGALRRLPRHDHRLAATALFGVSADAEVLNLEARWKAAGDALKPPVAPSTFRAKRGPMSVLLHEIATILREDEIRFRAVGHLPTDGIPASRFGERPWYAIAAEEQFGYRWKRYSRTLQGPDGKGNWRDEMIVTIEFVRPGIETFSYEYRLAEEPFNTAAWILGEEQQALIEQRYLREEWWRRQTEDGEAQWGRFVYSLPRPGEPGEEMSIRCVRRRGANYTPFKDRASYGHLLSAHIASRFDSLEQIQFRIEPTVVAGTHVWANTRHVFALGIDEVEREWIPFSPDISAFVMTFDSPIAGCVYGFDTVRVNDDLTPDEAYGEFLDIRTTGSKFRHPERAEALGAFIEPTTF